MVCGLLCAQICDHLSNLRVCLSLSLCAQIRDHLTNFFTNLNSSAPAFLEKYGGASDNSDMEALPEEVQAMLGDKDTLLNAIQVGSVREGGMTFKGPGRKKCGSWLVGARVGFVSSRALEATPHVHTAADTGSAAVHGSGHSTEPPTA